MFESVTKKRKNPIINIFGWSLLTLVCVVFIFVGFSPDSSFLGSGGAAAEVNGDAISLRDYKELLDRLENNQGEDRDARQKVQENAVNILVSRSLIVQEAEKLNIHVSDREVANELMTIEPFFEDGEFSRLRYKTYLQQARLTESEFEDRIRRDLIIQKMSQLVGFAGRDLEMMDDFDKKIDQAQINVAYSQFNPASFKSQVDKSSELAKFIDANQEKIQEYYETNSDKFSRPEEVKARHILIKSDDQSEEGLAVALAKANKIKSSLTEKNFEQMARLHSDDPGSKNKGGSLGSFPRGRMVPEFENAAFSAPVGKILDPVKSQFGYHLILVEDKSPALSKSLDEVKTEIAIELRSKDQFDQFATQIKEFLKAQDQDSVEALLEKNKLQWSTTGFFSITRDTVPGVGQSPEFLELALSLGPQNEYADRLVYQGEKAYILKFKGAQVAPDSGQKDQMDFFKQLMRQQKMNGLVQSWADSLREKASVKINPELFR